MSEHESFSEMADRLRREREGAQPRKHDQPGAGRRHIPAPLRLPAGDARRKSTFPAHIIPGPRGKCPESDLPPPLYTGMLTLKTGGYAHRISSWRWDSKRCLWIGACSACGYSFKADRATAAWLERSAEEEADRLAGRA